jgi:cytochrome c-type biogenesis protein
MNEMVADLGAAFGAGLLSCASACVLPLLPAFVGYLGGVAAPSARPGRLAVIGAAGLFVAGFATVFVALGAGAALLGAGLAAYRPALVTASGVVLVALGVTLVAGVPWLAREWRFQVAHRLPRTPLAAYVVGLAFAAGWTPCVGPILAGILVLAGDTATVGRGAALLAAYSAGLGLPFLALSAFVAPATALLARVRGAYPALNAAAAVLLIAMGALTLTNRLTALNGLFPDLGLAAAPARLSQPVPAQPVASRLVGRPAPAVTVAGVAGSRLDMHQLRGRPVVVNFWATWCVPCRQELPLFAAAARAHAPQGLTIVPVDYEESPDVVSRFWRELGLDLTAYLDPDGIAARAFGVGLQETGLPVTVLVDRDGVVRSVLPGEVDPVAFAARLDGILEERKGCAC